jgi:undecaprenyl-diphosphatase
MLRCDPGILGAVEGITEFLPVSSTGHLLLVEHWLGRHQSDLFNTVIQCGAVLAVALIFTQRIKDMALRWRDPRTFDYLLKLGGAFFVTALGGVVLKAVDFQLPETSGPVAWATLVGGVLFLVVEHLLRGRATSDSVTWTVALAIGGAQLLAAVFPGFSRSGSTILMGLALGLARPAAVEFSFLLGIPTLLAAGGVQVLSALRHPGAETIDWGTLALASAVAAVTAFAAVRWMLRFVQTHTFVAFGWYRIVLGTLILWGTR